MGHRRRGGGGRRSGKGGEGEVSRRTVVWSWEGSAGKIAHLGSVAEPLLPSLRPPSLSCVQGALVSGTLSYYPFADADRFNMQRTSASTRVSVHESIAMTAATMALTHHGITVRACELFHGVYQKYTLDGVL